MQCDPKLLSKIAKLLCKIFYGCALVSGTQPREKQQTKKRKAFHWESPYFTDDMKDAFRRHRSRAVISVLESIVSLVVRSFLLVLLKRVLPHIK